MTDDEVMVGNLILVLFERKFGNFYGVCNLRHGPGPSRVPSTTHHNLLNHNKFTLFVR